MEFQKPFLKLPIRFDAAAIAEEMNALPPEAWDPHPSGFVGNEAVKLVAPYGEITDSPEGPMAATKYLKQCDYVQELMGVLGAVWGRSRFMGLAAGREVPAHVDIHYYWRTHLRIHIPVVTNPGVLFTCGDETVHMAEGECWLFDSFRNHNVQNKGEHKRTHLVIDTVGGGIMHDLIAASQAGRTEGPLVRPGSAGHKELAFEKLNTPVVMSPWEMRCHLSYLLSRSQPHPLLPAVKATVIGFIDQWAAAWVRFGESEEGFETYAGLVAAVRRNLEQIGGGTGGSLLLINDIQLYAALNAHIFKIAFGRTSEPADFAKSAPAQRLAS